MERIRQIGIAAAAREGGVSRRTALKWKQRFKQEGMAGLRDRSSRPHQLRAALSPQQRAQAVQWRSQRWTIRGIADKTRRVRCAHADSQHMISIRLKSVVGYLGEWPRARCAPYAR